MSNTFRSNFLGNKQAEQIVKTHGSPIFVYSRRILREQANIALSTPAPYGLTISYAMKANSHPDILKLFRESGLEIDASSGYEAEIAILNGYEPEQILLTSQELPRNLGELLDQGVQFNATSLRQLEVYGQAFPKTKISVRLNPGIGSGHSAKVDVGGVTSSFGIWHEYIPQIHELVKKYELTVKRMHTHIGAGTDPMVWQEAAKISLNLIKKFPDAEIINLGGGFKVARMDYEEGTDLHEVGKVLNQQLVEFACATGRKLKLELEPGTFMVANAGMLIAAIDDIVDTGPNGYTFMKLNTGMNDILRPGLYGSQHPIAVLNDAVDKTEYVVVGHNCESGDLLTPVPGNPEKLSARLLNKAKIGDLVLIGGTGAYCASMAARGYNSFPDAKSIMVE